MDWKLVHQRNSWEDTSLSLRELKLGYGGGLDHVCKCLQGQHQAQETGTKATRPVRYSWVYVCGSS